MKRLHKTNNLDSTRQDRRGAILVAAIICLMLTTVLLTSAIKVAISGRKQLRQDQLQMQAEWLADAGVKRAVSRLQADSDYNGETWKVAADQLDGRRAGEVVLAVQPIESEASGHRVIATATYPAAAATSVRRTREVIISLKQP